MARGRFTVHGPWPLTFYGPWPLTSHGPWPLTFHGPRPIVYQSAHIDQLPVSFLSVLLLTWHCIAKPTAAADIYPLASVGRSARNTNWILAHLTMR